MLSVKTILLLTRPYKSSFLLSHCAAMFVHQQQPLAIISSMNIYHRALCGFPFLPHDAMHSAAFVIMQFPSVSPPVCLSRSCIESDEYTYSLSVRPTIIVFPFQTLWQ